MAKASAQILGSGTALLTLWLAALGPFPASAQIPLIRGYYQNVPLWSRSTDFYRGGFGDFNRFRLMSEPSFGPFSLDIAYEHAPAWSRQLTDGGFLVAGIPEGSEWLDLQWTIRKSDLFAWQHRFDRLNIQWSPTGALDLTLGRQTASWATTLFLTPADPFSPFNPADPFRVFRGGIDAARVQFYPGPLSQIDIVVRPTRSTAGQEITALGRGLTTWRGWEVSGWTGALYGQPAAAVAASGSLGSTALRGEATLRRIDGKVILRSTIGIDHQLSVSSRDLYLVVEYQHDGLGAASPEEYQSVVESNPFARGELQVLGRDETAVQAQYQIHPLWSLSMLWLWNLNDHSALLAPSLSYSASNEVTIMGGFFKGFGDFSSNDSGNPTSEYGALNSTVYLSVSVFF